MENSLSAFIPFINDAVKPSTSVASSKLIAVSAVYEIEFETFPQSDIALQCFTTLEWWIHLRSKISPNTLDVSACIDVASGMPMKLIAKNREGRDFKKLF